MNGNNNSILPLILAMTGSGGGGTRPIIISAESNTTINGYQVPFLTTANIQTIYNGIVAGSEVLVSDATGNMHFKVNQADTDGDDLFISFVYYDIMILQYDENENITYKKIPSTASDIVATNTQTVQQNLERIDDELSIRQVVINIEEFPEELTEDFLYRVEEAFTHDSKTYSVGLYQVINNDLDLIIGKSYVDNAIGNALGGSY